MLLLKLVNSLLVLYKNMNFTWLTWLLKVHMCTNDILLARQSIFLPQVLYHLIILST